MSLSRPFFIQVSTWVFFESPLEADGEPKHFRYDVSMKTKCSVLTPKPLDAEADLGNVRASMLGATFHPNYHKIPQASKVVRLLWEVPWYFYFRECNYATPSSNQ